MAFKLGQDHGHPALYRGKAAMVHILFSMVFLATPLVIATWMAYPGALFWHDGGSQLIKIALGVDLALGPSLTFLAFSPKKKPKLIFMDLAVILVLQLIAFGYGFHSMWMERPAGLVYSERAFRSISRAQMLGEPSAEVARQMDTVGAPLLYYKFPSTKPMELQKFLVDAQRDGRAYNVRAEHWLTFAQVSQDDIERMGRDDMLLSHVEDKAKRAQIEAWLHALPKAKQGRVKIYAMSMRYSNKVVAFDLDERKIVKIFDADPGSLMTL
jgi:hypothetical protein